MAVEFHLGLSTPYFYMRGRHVISKSKAFYQGKFLRLIICALCLGHQPGNSSSVSDSTQTGAPSLSELLRSAREKLSAAGFDSSSLEVVQGASKNFLRTQNPLFVIDPQRSSAAQLVEKAHREGIDVRIDEEQAHKSGDGKWAAFTLGNMVVVKLAHILDNKPYLLVHEISHARAHVNCQTRKTIETCSNLIRYIAIGATKFPWGYEKSFRGDELSARLAELPYLDLNDKIHASRPQTILQLIKIERSILESLLASLPTYDNVFIPTYKWPTITTPVGMVALEFRIPISSNKKLINLIDHRMSVIDQIGHDLSSK